MLGMATTPRLQGFLRLLGVAVLYALLVKVSLVYLVGNHPISMIWLPSGLAMAAILVGGHRYVWSIFVGTLMARLPEGAQMEAFGMATGAALEMLVGAWLLTQNSRSAPDFVHFHIDNPRLVVLAGVACTMVNALVSTTTLLLSGTIALVEYFPGLCRWWMGDVLGIVVLTSFILVWIHPPRDWMRPKRWFEALLVLGAAFVVGQAVFMGWFHDALGDFAKGYLMFVFVTLAALRLGTHGALTVILMAAVQGLLGAFHGVGYFAKDIAGTQLVNYWFYMAILSFVGISLAIFITAERRDREALRDKERFFRLITDNIDDLIAVVDLDGKRLYNSPSYAKLFGDDKRLVLTDSFAEIHPDDRERVKQVFRETVRSGVGQRIEFRFELPDGSIRNMESRGGVIRNVEGEPLCVAVVSHDITERKKTEETIYKLAYYDSLTQLPNRLMLKDRFASAVATSKRSRRYAALVVLDLDNFKPLNDMHGHSAGDLLLIEAASRIGSVVREVDTVARFGGDEYVVIVTGLDEDKSKAEEQAAFVAEKIRQTLAEPYRLQLQSENTELMIEHHCTSSIGVALFWGAEATQEEVFKWADMAMYRAKEGGRNQVRFYET